MKARGKLLSLAAGKEGSIISAQISLAPDGLEELTGQEITIDIAKYHKKRSLNANAYFHALCGGIAEKIGLSLIEVKNRMIADYGQYDKDMGAVIMLADIEWEKIPYMHVQPTTRTKVLDDGKLYRVYRIMRGSHTYDTKEMARLINGTQTEAKELGVPVLADLELERIIKRWEGQNG